MVDLNFSVLKQNKTLSSGTGSISSSTSTTTNSSIKSNHNTANTVSSGGGGQLTKVSKSLSNASGKNSKKVACKSVLEPVRNKAPDEILQNRDESPIALLANRHQLVQQSSNHNHQSNYAQQQQQQQHQTIPSINSQNESIKSCYSSIHSVYSSASSSCTSTSHASHQSSSSSAASSSNCNNKSTTRTVNLNQTSIKPIPTNDSILKCNQSPQNTSKSSQTNKLLFNNSTNQLNQSNNLRQQSQSQQLTTPNNSSLHNQQPLTKSANHSNGSNVVSGGTTAGTTNCQPFYRDYDISKRKYLVGLNLFNRKPEKGINHLIEEKFLDRNPRTIAEFLFNRNCISKQMIGDYISNTQDKFIRQVLHEFVQLIDLRNLPVDEALRKFQTNFRMPCEAQKIEHLTRAFSTRYIECNKLECKNMFNCADDTILCNHTLKYEHTQPERETK